MCVLASAGKEKWQQPKMYATSEGVDTWNACNMTQGRKKESDNKRVPGTHHNNEEICGRKKRASA